MKPLDISKNIEQQIHDLLIRENEDKAFELAKPLLFGVETDGDEVHLFDQVTEAEDIYDLLSSDGARFAAKWYDCIVLVTTGWASPLPDNYDGNDEDLPAPSKHEARRRVRLLVCASADSVTSVVRFQDLNEVEVMGGDDSGRGPLADAVQSLFS
jgi:hypothetical protein